MIFRPELAEAVMRGEKTVTRRLCTDNPRSPWFHDACTYRFGQTVAVQPGRGKTSIGSAVVTSVRRERLGYLSPAEARREGFASVDDFELAFVGINGAYDPDACVWRIELASPQEAAL